MASSSDKNCVALLGSLWPISLMALTRTRYLVNGCRQHKFRFTNWLFIVSSLWADDDDDNNNNDDESLFLVDAAEKVLEDNT